MWKKVVNCGNKVVVSKVFGKVRRRVTAKIIIKISSDNWVYLLGLCLFNLVYDLLLCIESELCMIRW